MITELLLVSVVAGLRHKAAAVLGQQPFPVAAENATTGIVDRDGGRAAVLDFDLNSADGRAVQS